MASAHTDFMYWGCTHIRQVVKTPFEQRDEFYEFSICKKPFACDLLTIRTSKYLRGLYDDDFKPIPGTYSFVLPQTPAGLYKYLRAEWEAREAIREDAKTLNEH